MTTFQPNRAALSLFFLGLLAFCAGCKKEGPKAGPRKIALGFTAAGTVKNLSVHAGDHLRHSRHLMALEPAWLVEQRAAEEARQEEERAVAYVASSEERLGSATMRAGVAHDELANHTATEAKVDRAEEELALARAGLDRSLKNLADVRARKATAASERQGHALPAPHVAGDAVHTMLDGWTLDWPPDRWEYRQYSARVESVLVKDGDALAPNAVAVIIVEEEEDEAKEH